MIKPLTLILILAAIPLSLSSQNSTPGGAGKTQKAIIKELSGATSLENGTLIENRSSSGNRKLTRTYLSDLISDMGLNPEVQDYVMPNVNPLVDILFNPFKGANVFTILPNLPLEISEHLV